jgi:hypothetical protein
MLDHVKVIWKSWNKVPNQTYRVLKDNQFRVFRSMAEANAFIKELEQTPGVIHIRKETHEFFRVNDIDQEVR